MTDVATENQQINNFPTGYNTVPDTTEDQTRILIENEQLRAENEVARAVLTAHRRQQEENRKCCSGPGAVCGGLITGGIIIICKQFAYNIYVLIHNHLL